MKRSRFIAVCGAVLLALECLMAAAGGEKPPLDPDLLEREVKAGMDISCETEEMDFDTALDNLSRLLKPHPPLSISLDYEMGDPDEVSALLNALQPIESIQAGGRGDPTRLIPIMEKMGTRPDVKKLFFFCPVKPADYSKVLKNFPNLEVLCAVPGLMNGEGLPELTQLQELDISFSPVTDAGLEKILTLPKLKTLTLKQTLVTARGLRLLESQGGHVPDIAISGGRFTSEDIDRTLSARKKRFPATSITVLAGQTVETERILALLERETKAGLVILKDKSPGGFGNTRETLSALLEPHEPLRVSLAYEMGDPREVAEVLRAIVPICEITADQGDRDKFVALLAALGHQASVKQLLFFNVEFPKDFGTLLAQFPNLENLAAVPTAMTGEEFPNLQHLLNADLSLSPISDQGLKNLLKLPKLRGLFLKQTAITTNGLEILETEGGQLDHVRISGGAFTQNEANTVITGRKKNFPDSTLDLHAK